jgi:hypothetical protein
MYVCVQVQLYSNRPIWTRVARDINHWYRTCVCVCTRGMCACVDLRHKTQYEPELHETSITDIRIVIHFMGEDQRNRYMACVCVCVCVCIRVIVSIHVCMYAHLYICAFVSRSEPVRSDLCGCLCMHVCLYVCMYACMHICMISTFLAPRSTSTR